jgi:hypothetical protein
MIVRAETRMVLDPPHEGVSRGHTSIGARR